MNVDQSQNSSMRSAGDDPALTALLRSTYAAPTDAAYWSGLEQRVLTRVRESGPVAWWAVLSEWRAAGMVAAAAAVFLVGATAIREQQYKAMERVRAAMAIEANPFDTTVEPVNIAISPASPNSQRVRSSAPEHYLDLIRP